MAEALSGDHPAIGGIRLVLGGNVFGWTIDSDQGFRVLDTFFEAGGRMIDSAEGYSSWVPGNKGGESEAIVGAWMESRGVRKDMLVATKTGQSGAPGCLAASSVATALEGSLERLRTDYIDLYYAHRDDPETALEDVIGAFDAAFRAGKVRELGASNHTPARLAEAFAIANRIGARSYTVVQQRYNLIDRHEYEGAMQDLCVAHGIAVLPYYGLASGFLTGKFRAASDWNSSRRAHALNNAAANGGWNVLAALDAISVQNGATPAQIALAWLNAKPGIAAPICSATSPEQVTDLVGGIRLELTPTQLSALDEAGAAVS